MLDFVTFQTKDTHAQSDILVKSGLNLNNDTFYFFNYHDYLVATNLDRFCWTLYYCLSVSVNFAESGALVNRGTGV